jgi:Trk-type K+ transport system membrane component
MPTAPTRKYTTSDAILLITLSTIVDNAITNLPFWVTKRSIWVDPFFTNLQTRINTIIQTYLGVDNAKDLRNATKAVEAIQK